MKRSLIFAALCLSLCLPTALASETAFPDTGDADVLDLAANYTAYLQVISNAPQ